MGKTKQEQELEAELAEKNEILERIYEDLGDVLGVDDENDDDEE